MRILNVIDSKIWAISQLANVIRDENKHHQIEIMEIHPKDYRRESEKFNIEFEKKIIEFRPQIIHFYYWDTAKSLSELPCTRGIKKILTITNQRNLLSHRWDNIDVLVVSTEKAKTILEKAGYWNVELIPYGIDIEKFKFNENYDTENRMLGYCGRIVSWKGLYEILKLAKEINSEVVMMGRIDSGGYWQKCQEFSEQMDIRFDTPDDKQTEVYHEMACYIGNSSDDIESGTLPFLEAMACGIPVITTPSGMAKDIVKHGENGLICEFDDYNSLRTMIERFLQMKPEEKQKMREAAWNTVRNLSKQVMARKYEKLYYTLSYKNDLVSVIIPTCKRHDTITQVLDGYTSQSYEPIELVVVVDDKFSEEYESILFEWQKNNNIPVKWFYDYNQGYGLAQARNMGIFESAGNYLVFNDDRFVPSPIAVQVFVNNLKVKKGLSAVWGDKGGGKRDFIENFFIIRKKHIIDAGMFNERINEYGGMSQEIRERLKHQGFDLQFEAGAIAKPMFGTHSKTKRRYELFRMKTKYWLLRN